MMKTGAKLLTFLLLSMSVAQAQVSLRNGNFFTEYTDLLYPGGFDPKIQRIYNSKTDWAKGIFGPGWGFEYEAFLKVSADGSVVIHEYGGGAENRFSPVAFNAHELDKAVDTIAAAAKASGVIGSASQLDSYKKRLKSDMNYRNEQWESFRRTGKIQARQLAVGTKLQSNKYSYQFVTRVEGGYLRTYETGKSEKFNDSGKLVRVSDKNGNYIDLSYGSDGHLARIVDNQGRRMSFSYTNKGLVSSIEGENGKKAKYEYDSSNMLVKSTDTEGNTYTFKYEMGTTNLVPNLLEIGYSDKTTMKISYWGKDKNQNVKGVKDRDGTFTEYNYGSDSRDAGYTMVNVTVRPSERTVDAKGKAIAPISVSKYEYFMKRKADGEEWQYKLVTTLDGDRTETIYNECCGLPLLIKHNAEETSFEYDTKGHVTKKITPNEVTELSYHPQVGKVTKVVRYSKRNKKQSTWSQFEYDEKGNLTFAKNSDKKGVRLFYDANGRIRSMVDQDRRRIDFKYNENSKPVEISDPSLGTISVAYKQSGEIDKVESTAGRKIALQVTSAFQNLLDIIRPAGVSLSF
jgi:YD repeat-containing protein